MLKSRNRSDLFGRNLPPFVRRGCRTSGLALAVWLLASTGGFAQDWAKDMFDHTSKDLGAVARGAKVEHVFTFENIYLEDVHVSSLRSSCGCTTPKVDKPWLKTYEKAHVTTVIDTRKFLGRRESTITVTFDKPFAAEVRLMVYCTIRGDVVFHPGSVQFGSVPQGSGAQQKVTVTYAGRSNWRILRVESPNPDLDATATEVSRAPDPTTGSTLVTYDLLVNLKNTAPAGYIRDHLTLMTDDENLRTSRVPLSVEGVATSSLTAKPSPLLLGPLAAGGSITKPLVVQAARPFSVVNVTCSDSRFTFTVPSGAKNVHLVPVQFTAGDTPGRYSGVIRIETDLPEQRFIEVKADAQVLAKANP